jgi:hypothetical protein
MKKVFICKLLNKCFYEFNNTQEKGHKNIRFSLNNFVMALREFTEFNQQNGYKY